MSQKDITGQKFNRLTAIKFVERRGRDYFWLFKCDCGKEKILHKSGVMIGQSKSCGCIQKEVAKKANGEKNYNWKGNNVGYYTFHSWINKKNKKIGICVFCGRKNVRIEYAIKKGKKYSRNVNDYLELCCRCHTKYDGYTKKEYNGKYICSRCGKKRKKSEFYNSKVTTNHLTSWCINCYKKFYKN